MNSPDPCPVLTPVQRLDLSRERIHAALRGVVAKPETPAGSGLGRSWLTGLVGLPGLGILSQALQIWWAGSPLRDASALLSEAATTWLQPMAKRNPLALVSGAFLLGGLFGWSRPWRWAVKPGLLIGLASKIVTSSLRRPPSDGWASIVAALCAVAARPGSPVKPGDQTTD